MVVPGWLLVAVGLIVFAVAVVFSRRARRQWSWPQVSATITRSDVIVSAGYYSADIEYTYVYEGRQFRGNKVRSLEISVNWRLRAEGIASRYPAGGVTQASVNPELPGDAVLEPGGDRWFVPFFFLFASIPVVIGIIQIAKG